MEIINNTLVCGDKRTEIKFGLAWLRDIVEEENSGDDDHVNFYEPDIANTIEAFKDICHNPEDYSFMDERITDILAEYNEDSDELQYLINSALRHYYGIGMPRNLEEAFWRFNLLQSIESSWKDVCDTVDKERQAEKGGK